MTWQDIEGGTGSHPIPKNDLVKVAQDRLTTLRMDDLDDVFSLRLSNTKRIFGVRVENILKILWYDPDHHVCPSPKKNT